MARNTSEGGNPHTKATYPHKRSQSTVRVATLLDLHHYFFLDNVKTWYFQGDFRSVDPVLHPSAVELRGMAALASWYRTTLRPTTSVHVPPGSPSWEDVPVPAEDEAGSTE